LIVVIDSSVWISALHYGGKPLAALDHVFVHNQIAICHGILNEIESILTLKFLWERQDFADSLNEYLADAIHVELPDNVRSVCRDPKDDMVLECAVTAQAQVIVSGDKDLLTLGEYEGIRILSPRGYLEDAGSRPS
jgi:putative PIN family toxin of toxin-antitoxin system